MNESQDDLASELTLTSDNYPLGRILKRIESDVSSISLSRTDSDQSTLLAFNTPGSAIASVGQLASGWAERVRRRARLHKIDAYLKSNHDYIPPEYFADLLELQRAGLYPKGVRRQAWNLLLVLLQRRRTERIVEVIVAWPSIEVQLFVRQLAAFKLSGWTLYPDKLVESQEMPSGSSSSTPEIDTVSLVHSCRSILGALLRQDADMLHEFLGVDEYLALQLPSTDDPKCEVLSLFFADLANEFKPNSTTPWILPLFANDFVDFLRTGHFLQVKPVVDYIIQALKPFTFRTDLVPKSHSRGAFPLIWFSAHLFLASPLARDQFVDSGLLDIIEQIWDFSSNPSITDEHVSNPLQTACCLVVGAYSAIQVVPNLAHQLRKERVVWFLAIFTHYVSNHRLVGSICSSRCCSFESELLDRQRFYKEFLDVATDPVMDDAVRGGIHNILTYEMGQTSYEQLGSALLELTDDRAEHLISQFMHMRLDGWDNYLGKEGDPSMLSRKFRRILTHVMTPKPSILYNSIDVGTFALAQTNVVCQTHSGSSDGLTVFFNDLALEKSLFRLGYRLPSGASTFIQYLDLVPLDQLTIVVDYISATLRQSTSQDNLQSPQFPLGNVLDRTSEGSTYPCAPFLVFATHLSYYNEGAAQLLLADGIVGSLQHLWQQSSEAASTPESIATRIAVSSQILLLLVALAKHQLKTLVSQLRGCTPKAWFIDADLPITNVHLSLVLRGGGWVDMSKFLQDVVRDVTWDGTAPSQCMQSMITLPSDEDDPKCGILSLIGDNTFDSNIRFEAIEQLLTLCASTPESEWREMAQIIGVGYRHTMLRFIIQVYLGCVPQRSEALPERLKVLINKLYKLSESLGYHPSAHPIDRLVLLFHLSAVVGSNQSRHVQALISSGFYDLLFDLDSGIFDNLETNVPGGYQRNRNFNWVKRDFEMIVSYGD